MNFPPSSFLQTAEHSVLLDVRSPGEFAKGHLPKAISFPLFSDEERAIIGTAYKQQGKDMAVKMGLDMIGPRMAKMVEKAEELSSGTPIALYCWRGGMRSNSVAWLLRKAGMQVEVLEGGYKAYRTFLSDALIHKGNLLVLGGYTGSAKTHILHLMRTKGAQVLDIEGIAKHKGSAFGNLYEDEQPETEQFINLLGEAFSKLDHTKPIWTEDESRTIGNVWLPEEFYKRLRSTNVIAILRSVDERARFLADDYGNIEPEKLKIGFSKIARRLGGQNVQAAQLSIEEGDLFTAAKIGLTYYDKTYQHGLSKRDKQTVTKLPMEGKSNEEIADYLLSMQESWISRKI